MEEFELDENGYKKSNLSLEEMTGWTMQKQSAHELNQWQRLHSKEGATEEFHKKSVETKRASGYFQDETHKKVSSAGGKIAGQIRKQKDDWKDHIKKMHKGTLDARAIVRHEKYTAVLDSLPEEFTAKQLHETNKVLGYKKGINMRFMISNNYIEKCYEGTPGSKFDVARWKRIDK